MNEATYQALFQGIDDGFCVVEVLLDDAGQPADYRFLDCNPTFSEHTGLVDPIGRTALELVPQLSRWWVRTYGAVALTGEPVRFEHEAPAMGGRTFAVHAFRLGAPEARRVAIFFKNITDRRTAERALRASEARFRDFADTAPAVLWVTEPDGSCSFLSRGWLELTGQPTEQGLGFGWLDAVHPDERESARASLLTAHASRRPLEIEHRLRAADGTYRWVLIVGRPRIGADGEHAGNIGSVIDIDERRRLLAEAEAARAEAEEANRSKDEFLAVVSHELRTPLNAILGWAKLLQTGRLDGRGLDQGLAAITRNATAQARLIEDLLDVSRIISGKLRLELQPVSPVDVVEAALGAAQPAADAKGIRVVRALEPETAAVVADPARLEQVVTNLLSNAVKFTPPGGEIRVEVAIRAQRVQIRIVDTELGICPELLPHVFDRFRQADASSARSHAGLGLGLSIVRQLVEMHRGTVHAESEGLGKGSTFVVELPIARAHDGVARSGVAGGDDGDERAKAPLAGVRVLAVDDEPDARALLDAVFRSSGAEVVSAASTEEALAALEGSAQPDVLVSDVGMPRRDGYELVREVRSRGRSAHELPAVALTAFAHEADRSRAMTAGFQVHLAKPVDPAELVAIVGALAGRGHGR